MRWSKALCCARGAGEPDVAIVLRVERRTKMAVRRKVPRCGGGPSDCHVFSFRTTGQATAIARKILSRRGENVRVVLRNEKGGCDCSRRVVLGTAMGLLPWWAASSKADDDQDPTEILPQVGDHFVYLVGPMEGQVVKSADLKEADSPIQVYPADPGGRVRDGSRLNLVILARVDTTGVSADTLAHSADGVVAYSGVCTHQGCPVNMWSTEHAAFYCSCHGSIYNPKDGAEVLGGPAPRALPALPLKSADGVLLVASGFTGAVGPTLN
jgi:rieske iron-sulfur protein